MCIKKKGGKNEPWMDRKKQVNKDFTCEISYKVQ